MTGSKLVAFLPLRKGSERVIEKNTRPFNSKGESLLEIKLTQLLRVENFERIVVSTNDEEVLLQASSIGDHRIVLDRRPDSLCLSTTPISDLSKYAAQVSSSELILWTHVTSPFFGSNQYIKVIDAMKSKTLLGKDSVATITPLQEFILDSSFNPTYDSEGWRIWPRTQDVKPYYYFNSAAFLAPSPNFASGARLGPNPHFFLCEKIESLDIDTEDDWELAQCIDAVRVKREN